MSALLHKYNNAQIIALPAPGNRHGFIRIKSLRRLINTSERAHLAHDRGMSQLAPRIFSARNVRREVVFGEGEDHFGHVSPIDGRDVFDADIEPELLIVFLSLWLWDEDRKSTRMKFSNLGISYVVFFL